MANKQKFLKLVSETDHKTLEEINERIKNRNMKAEEISQWVIDNRYPKSELVKITDLEMFHSVMDSIEKYTQDQIKKDRHRIINECTFYKEWECSCMAGGHGYIEADRNKIKSLPINLD